MSLKRRPIAFGGKPAMFTRRLMSTICANCVLIAVAGHIPTNVVIRGQIRRVIGREGLRESDTPRQQGVHGGVPARHNEVRASSSPCRCSGLPQLSDLRFWFAWSCGQWCDQMGHGSQMQPCASARFKYRCARCFVVLPSSAASALSEVPTPPDCEGRRGLAGGRRLLRRPLGEAQRGGSAVFLSLSHRLEAALWHPKLAESLSKQFPEPARRPSYLLHCRITLELYIIVPNMS